MNLHITKSKNAESFYICRSYVKANGSTTSTIIRKLGTLEHLLIEHGPGVWQLNNEKIPRRPHKTCFFYVKFFVFIYVILYYCMI